MKNKRKRLDWSNYNSIEEIQEFIDQNEIETSTDFNKNFGGLARRISKLGFKYSNFKFKRNINRERERWTFLKTKSDIENYINKNNIKKFSDLEEGLRTRLGRLGYISTDFFSSKNTSWKNLKTKEEIQKEIDKTGVKKFSDLEDGFKSKIWSLGFTSKNFLFKEIKNDWSSYSSLGEIQKFINNNNIKTKTEFIQKFSGLYRKSVKLGIYNKLIFINSKTKVFSIDPKEFNSLQDFQDFIDKNKIKTYTEFKNNYGYLLYRLNTLSIKTSLLNFPIDGRHRIPSNEKWGQYNSLSDFQNFIDLNNIETCTEFDKNFGGLSRRLSRLGFSLTELDFKIKNSSSHLEKNIRSFLENNNINFIEQKKFKELGNLRYDFYLPDYNLALEPGGEQHFISINRWGGEDELKKIKERDKRKYDYCIQNGITILYYFEFSRKNIYSILSKDGYMGEWFTDFDLFTNRILEIMGKS